MSEKILLTGATGIIGTHFLYSFEKRKDKPHVTAIYRNEIPVHLERFDGCDWVDFQKIDIATEDITELWLYDTIIHAATYGQPSKFMNQEITTLRLNTSVTDYLLGKCLRPNGRFLFLSSSEVYHGLKSSMFSEEYIGNTTPYHKRAAYIEGKRSGEAIVNAYRNAGDEAKSVRVSLAYGDGTKPNDERVINQFIAMALRDGVIKMRDRGLAHRTYCYVGDAVDMMLNVLYNGSQPVYNIGGVSDTTIFELADSIAYLTNAEVAVGDDEDTSAPNNTKMSIDRYVKEFGRPSFTPFCVGIQRAIEHQKQFYATNK